MSIPNVFHQAAWVVDNLAAAEAHWINVVGVPSFFHMHDIKAADVGGTYRGEPGAWGMDVALGYHGELMIELIKPTAGPSVYDEFLAEGGRGIHHLGYRVDDLEASSRALSDQGYEVVQSVEMPGLRAVYHDTTTDFGVMTELIHIDDAMRRMFRSIRDAT